MNTFRYLCATSALMLGWISAQAQPNPLWERTELGSVEPVLLSPEDTPEAVPLSEILESIAPPAVARTASMSVPESIDAEIESLAEALDNDPIKIFNYVRNNIDYDHYYGLRKGAKLTLLEGSGNDADQCALLAELLRAAGHPAILYVRLEQIVRYQTLMDWIGLAQEPYPDMSYYEVYGQEIIDAFPDGADNGVGDLVAKQTQFGGRLLSAMGSQLQIGTDVNNAPVYSGVGMFTVGFPNYAGFILDRFVLYFNFNGTPYFLDPSYKTYEKVEGLDGLLADAGYDRAQLLSLAEGTTGNGYVQSLNQGNIGNYLASLNSDLLDEIQSAHPGISFREIISGRRIIEKSIDDLSDAFDTSAFLVTASKGAGGGLAADMKTSVRFQAGDIDETLYTSDLNGRKISLTFNANTVELRLDDASPLATTSISGDDFTLTITVTQPGSLGDFRETKTYKKDDEFAYAIIYGFMPSGRLLQKRYEQLSQYLDEGKADDSREVRTELLNIMGLTWLYQSQLAFQVLADRNDVLAVFHHSFGRMAQEEGFYVDVGLQRGDYHSVDGVEDDGRIDNVFHLGTLFISAMEHGVIEQMQPNASAVSTVNILRQAVTRIQDGGSAQRLYKLTRANYASLVGSMSNYTSMNGIVDAGEYTDYSLDGRWGQYDSNGDGKITVADAQEPWTDKTTLENLKWLLENEGAETYADVNGNGKWDSGEPFRDKRNFQWDVGEAYEDLNANGQWDSGEPFEDTLGNGVYDTAPALYAQLMLPQNATVNPKLPDGTSSNWTGSGWVLRSNTQSSMIISGGYSGGYSYWPPTPTPTYHHVSSPLISTSSYYNPTYNNWSTALSTPRIYVPPSYSTPSFYGSDPVNMSTGAFEYSNTDLETGVDPAPRGLTFTRHYSSSSHDLDNQYLGYGWTHSLHIRATSRTATEEALGSGTPQQAASFLTAALVGADLYRKDATPKEWAVTVLAVGWFQDTLLDNAVSVRIGKDTFQFIKQPDGTYTAPAGSTMELTEDTSGNYILSQRHGNTMYFEPVEDDEGEGQRVQKIVDPDGKEMAFDYHTDDRINYVEDAYGRRYTFGYDGDNRINRIMDSTDSRYIEFRHDGVGNLDRVTDPEGKYFYFDYEVAGDPSETEASEHRIVRMRNHDDETVTQNVYDDLGRVEEQYLHGDTNQTWTMRYTGSENTEEDPDGGVTTYRYDERGRSVAKIDADGHETAWTYDGQDRVVTVTTAEEETTTYHYDNSHNITQIDYPRGGGSAINHYDSLNRLDDATDPDGNTTDYVYFTSGVHMGKNRPYQIVDEEGTTTFTYMDSGPAQGNVHTITDDDNLVTENAYDAFGQPDWTKAPGNFLTDFQYTARGDLDYVIDPNTVKTDYTYNARRQVTQVVYDQGGADEATETRTYDNMGNLESVTAPEDNDAQRVQMRFDYTATEKLHYEYQTNETATEDDDLVAEHIFDGRDWLESSFDAVRRETGFVYFPNGDLYQSNQPGSRTSEFGYDDDGRLIDQSTPGAPADREYGYQYLVSDSLEDDQTSGYPKTVFTDADALSVTSEFDRTGDLRYYTNKKDEVFEMRYDGLGRLTHVITPLDAANSRARITTYTHRGEPASITEPSGQTATFNYNTTSGRLESVDYSDGSETDTVEYTLYDNNGNLKTLTEGSESIQRTYDNLNRVKSYTDANGNTIGYVYYPSGSIAKIIYPGGSETGVGHVEYTYWKTGLLKNVIDKLDSTTAPRTTTYYWTLDGRLSRIVRPNGTERNVSYDEVGRPYVVHETSGTGELIALYKNNYFPSDDPEWIYQLPLPKTRNAAPNPVTAMTYNADNQLATFEGQTVAHDPDGNMTYGPLPNGTLGTYDYDIRNRLESAGGLTYGYDPEGERISLTGTGESITYVNENNLGLSKVIQRAKDGETVRYVWGVGLLYEVNSSGETTTYHYDNGGSTVALTDDAAEVVERIEYAPFGTQTYRQRMEGHEGNLHDTPFLWTGFYGNQTDSNGLVYLRNRYYNVLTRSFVNSDPAREGWNWYAYGAGNPISFVDPTGLGISSALDYTQTALSALGMIPVVGNVFDIVNAGISAARGNYVDAAINLAAALPGIGQAVAGTKLAGSTVLMTVRLTDKVSDVAKVANKLPTTRTFQGMEVRAVRGLGHVDDSTLRAMSQHGFAPKTINGDKIVLHHHQQNPAGFIVEVPAPNHSIRNVRQHPFGNQARAGLTAEQRTAFNQWRVDYWKSRATEELARRGAQ